MKKKTMPNQHASPARYGPDDGVLKNAVPFPAGGVAPFAAKCCGWLLSLILLLMFMLPGHEVGAQQCGTPPDSNTEQETSPEQNNPGPYTIRLYVYILRRSNGDDGFSQSEVNQILNYVQQHYAPHNIKFALACVDEILNSVFYQDPQQALNSNYGQSITNGLCLFLGDNSDYGLAGAADGTGPGARRCYICLPSLTEGNCAVVSHELGHLLNLHHTVRGCPCTTEANVGPNAFGDPATTGDLVTDTAPDSQRYPPDSDCGNWNAVNQVSCSPYTYTNPGLNVLRNFMSGVV